MGKKALFTIIIFACLLPFSAYAAGFAKQSLFLSRSAVTEGETVLIHAVVSNETAAKFAGELTFKDAGSTIGSVPVSLAAGESSVMSVSWKPAAGSHEVSAELKDSTGKSVEVQKDTFTIAAKPTTQTASSTQPAAAVESSKGIQQSIGGVSPQAEQYSAPIFSTLDSARSSAADVLDNQLASTKVKLGPGAGSPGEVLAAEATRNAVSNPWGALVYILQTLYFYLLTILRFIIGTAGVFYPVFAILFFYILWRVYRLFRRPAY